MKKQLDKKLLSPTLQEARNILLNIDTVKLELFDINKDYLNHILANNLDIAIDMVNELHNHFEQVLNILERDNLTDN